MIVEYLVIFLGMWIVSFVLSFIITYLSQTPTREKFFNTVFFLGIMVHELGHYVMCLLTRVKVAETHIFPERDEKGNLKGSINPAEPTNFLQSVLVCFAPLTIGTYIIGFMIFYMCSPIANWTISALLIYLIVLLSNLPKRRAIVDYGPSARKHMIRTKDFMLPGHRKVRKEEEIKESQLTPIPSEEAL